MKRNYIDEAGQEYPSSQAKTPKLAVQHNTPALLLEQAERTIAKAEGK